jgi:hypothetical protein
MAAKSKGSKNNIANRGKSAALRTFNGKEVKAVYYVGTNLGHGCYMAAKLDSGELVMDKSNKPIAYSSL